MTTLHKAERLYEIDQTLADVVRKAATYLADFDLFVVEGMRTLERQEMLVAKGASRTMKSKHLIGHAVDLAPMFGRELRWDWPLFHVINDAMQRAARELGVELVWGGNWRSFKDGPHWELKR